MVTVSAYPVLPEIYLYLPCYCLPRNTEHYPESTAVPLLDPSSPAENTAILSLSDVCLFAHLVTRYFWCVETEAAPGPQPVVDRDDHDLRLNEEMWTIQNTLASRQAAAMEPDKD